MLFSSTILKSETVEHPSFGRVSIRYLMFSNKEAKSKGKYYNQLLKISKESWGEFPQSYIINKVFNNDVLLIALNDEQIIGFNQYKFFNKEKSKKHYCSLGFSAVKTGWQGVGISYRLFARLFLLAFIQNLRANKTLNLEVLFETNNISALETIKPITTFLYPDPSKFDIKNNRIPVADKETWETAKHYLARIGGRVFRIQREGCVVTKSYDDMPNLIRRSSRDGLSDKSRAFASKYLRSKEKYGNEIVVRAKCSFIKFFSHVCL